MNRKRLTVLLACVSCSIWLLACQQNEGRIQTSFVRNNFETSSTTLKEMAESLPKAEVTREEKAYLQQMCTEVAPTIKDEFEKRLKLWNQAIKANPATLLSNDTHDYANLPQFDTLVEMGPSIVPLIVDKLCDEENFHLLVLYDTLQAELAKRITYEKGDVRALEGEQNRARRTVKLWVEKTKR